MANNRFRRNFLGSIESEGMVYDDPGQIRPTFSKHIFKGQVWRRPDLGGVFQRRISEKSWKSHSQLSLKLLHVKECCSFKAPGPRGFFLLNFSVYLNIL